MPPKFVCPQHATRKPYLSPHHTLATSVVLVFSYYLVLRAAFGAFSFFSRRQLQKLTGNIFPHLGCDKFTRRFLNLPGEHPLIRVLGKYGKTLKSLATSLNTWQTKDYYFNGKFYIYFFNDESSTCESLGAILTWSPMARWWPAV